MPDITMCTGVKCPKKDECYRFRAKPGPRQAYFAEPPIKGDDCPRFVQVELGDDHNL